MFNKLVLGALLVLACVRGHATTWYVANAGSDRNPGTQARPFMTIQKAADTGMPGDTVYISAGTYNESPTFKTVATESKRVVFTVQGSVIVTGSITVSGSFLTLDGFQSGMSALGDDRSNPPAIAVTGSNCVVKNCIVDNIPNPGPYENEALAVYIDGSNNLLYKLRIGRLNDTDAFHLFGTKNVIDSCEIFNLSNPNYAMGAHADCFQNWSDGGIASSNCLIENSFVHDFTGSTQIGILDAKGVPNGINNLTIRNNVFANIGSVLFFFVNNGKIYNNVFYRCCNVGNNQPVYLGRDSSGAQVINNVFFGCGVVGTEKTQGAINRKDAEKVTIDHNFFAGIDGSAKTTWPQNDIGTNAINGGNPGFASVTNYNFHLVAGSVLLNGGTSIAPAFPDADGIPRAPGPAWTIGAHGLAATP